MTSAAGLIYTEAEGHTVELLPAPVRFGKGTKERLWER